MSVIRSAKLPTSPEGHLGHTEFLDHEHPLVQRFVADAVGDAVTTRDKAIRLFYAVRDRIRYDPYRMTFDAPSYKASAVIEAGYGWCIPKAGLLAACARAVGIPSAVGLADVVNHMTTEKLRTQMGGVTTFYDHGYAALLIDGRWVKAVPAFNIELCERFGVKPTEFDGTDHALYQEFDVHDRRHMEYLADHGCWSDLPLDQVLADFRKHYGHSPMLQGLRVADGERFENDTPLT